MTEANQAVTAHSTSRLVALAKSFSRAASAAVILVGFLVLVAWMLDMATLKSVSPGLATMKANTALAFVVAGVSLWLLGTEGTNRAPRLAAQVSAFIVALIGLLTLSEYLLGWNLGIDELLFRDEAPGSSHPGRPSSSTALGFFLVGLALLLLDAGIRPSHRLAEFLTFTALLVSLLGLVGYAYGVGSLYTFDPFSSMALHTALTFFVLCAGILSAHADRGLMVVATCDSAGGVIMRRLLPATIAIPFILGWLILKGQQADLDGIELAFSLLVVAIMVVFAVLIWTISNSLDRTDTKRKRAEEALREQVRRDSLTGVLNHAAIVDELRSLLAENGEGASHAVAMVDVDGLKAVNDTFGHQVGDAVLVAVAKALSNDGAVVGRYGGDEFVTVIAGADRPAAERYRDAVLHELAHAGLTEPDAGASVPVVASIGLAIYPAEAATVTDLIKLSDNAMYASRRQRPVGTGGLSPARPLSGDRAAEMVGQLVPLLTSQGALEDKLKLVAHRISVGAGYDAVNIDTFSQPSGPPGKRNVFARVPDEVIETWRAEQQRVEDNPFAQLLLRTRRALIVEDPQNDERLTETQRSVLRAAELRSAVVVPLFWADELIGILSAASKREAAFGAQDVQFLTTVATQVTAIVRMATLIDDLQSTSTSLSHAQEETVLLLAAAAEAHDHTTGLHLKSVRTITEALASELGFSDGDTKALGLAAVLHDIGKVHVPDRILTSRGALAGEEWNLMKQHTSWGYEFLAGHEGYELASAIARSHHERWDGNGYPDGLASDSIPEAATIVTVADTFDAMTSDRPYRKARSVAATVREIVALSGEQFSPNVVDALVRLHKRRALTSSSKRVSHHRAAA